MFHLLVLILELEYVPTKIITRKTNNDDYIYSSCCGGSIKNYYEITTNDFISRDW